MVIDNNENSNLNNNLNKYNNWTARLAGLGSDGQGFLRNCTVKLSWYAQTIL
eukprot:Pgem_evm1s3776